MTFSVVSDGSFIQDKRTVPLSLREMSEIKINPESRIEYMVDRLEKAAGADTEADALKEICVVKGYLDATRSEWTLKPGPEHLEYLKYLYYAKCRLENKQWRLAAMEISDVLQDMALHSRGPDGHPFLDSTILGNVYYLLERMGA